MTPFLDSGPLVWWDDRTNTAMTRCLTCPRRGFPHTVDRPLPHRCDQCADLAAHHPARALYTACIATDQGPRHVQADDAAILFDPRSGRHGFAVTDGVGDEWEAATAAHLTAWSAAAAATTAGAAGALHTARAIWTEYYDVAPPGQEGNTVAVVAAPIHDTHGGGYDIAWCGDARAYAYHAGALTQLTTDHTRAQQMREEGMPAEWIGPRQENTILASIGRGAIDSTRVLAPVSRLLLCTDGVHRALPQTAITRALRVFTDPAAAAQRLVRAARRAGSTDNATALVIAHHVDRSSAQPPAQTRKEDQ
jgi:protein phosphatase